MTTTKTQHDVLTTAADAGLFRADIFTRASARKAVAALASKGLLARYGAGSQTQYRITKAGHAALCSA